MSTWLLNAFPRLRAQRVALAYRRFFGEQNRQTDCALILEDLSLYCGLRHGSFVPGSPDQTAFNEGQRDVLLHVLSLARLDPETLLDPLNTDPHSLN